jgi:hypothetical protein
VAVVLSRGGRKESLLKTVTPECLARLLLFLVLGVLLPGVCVSAADPSEPPAEPVLPMVRAMGGAHTAVAEGPNAIFTNPAGYALVEDDVISLFTLGIRINVDPSALKIYEAVLSGTDVTSPENIDDYFSNTTLTQGIVGPFQFGRVGNNFGFSFFNNYDAVLTTQPGGTIPMASAQVYSDLGLVGGYGFPLPILDNLYGGFNFKVILRAKAEMEGTIIAVIDTLSDPDTIPVAKAIGFGGDLGLLYLPAPWCTVGVAAKDFFGTRFTGWETLTSSGSPFPSSMIPPRIAVGVAFHPASASGDQGGRAKAKDFVVAVDYANLLDFSPFFTNVKAGMSLTTLRVLNLRIGLDGGYFTGGVGFDFKTTRIDLAYFVEELGSYPGANPAQIMMFNFAVRW